MAFKPKYAFMHITFYDNPLQYVYKFSIFPTCNHYGKTCGFAPALACPSLEFYTIGVAENRSE